MNPGIWTRFEGNPILGGERLGTCFDVNVVRVRREPVLVPESDCEKRSVMNPYVRWDAARGITGWRRLPQNPLVAPDLGMWDGSATYKPSEMRHMSRLPNHLTVSTNGD